MNNTIGQHVRISLNCFNAWKKDIRMEQLIMKKENVILKSNRQKILPVISCIGYFHNLNKPNKDCYLQPVMTIIPNHPIIISTIISGSRI